MLQDEVIQTIREAFDAGRVEEITGLSADDRMLSLICSFKSTGAVLFITVYEGIQG